jgi:hypothetical protein
LNSCEKYVETVESWLISLLYCIDVKIPLIDTVCAVSALWGGGWGESEKGVGWVGCDGGGVAWCIGRYRKNGKEK